MRSYEFFYEKLKSGSKKTFQLLINWMLEDFFRLISLLTKLLGRLAKSTLRNIHGRYFKILERTHV